MTQNQTEGYHTITPQTVVDDARETIEFVQEVFDAKIEEVYENEGLIMHAEARIGDSRIMMGSSTEDVAAFPFMLNVYVDDVDATFAKAVEHGATPLREPENQFYGDRTGGVRDTQGNQWWISTHIEDVSEEEIRRRMADITG